MGKASRTHACRSRIAPSPFTTGTTGVAHSSAVSGDLTPSATNRSKASDNLVVKAYGTVRVLQKRGVAFNLGLNSEMDLSRVLNLVKTRLRTQ